MNISEYSMCAILLCSHVGLNKDAEIKPLTITQWNKFLDFLIAQKLNPSVVFDNSYKWLEKSPYSEEEQERIKNLLSRGPSVAFELDDLERRGIGVITQFDKEKYPRLLVRKLKRKIPPVLFYAGNLELANTIGIGIVGSRNVGQEGIDFTRQLVQRATSQHLVIFSGGAKGVDTISERIALESGGAVVAFIADSLVSRVRKKDTIDNLVSGKLLLFTDTKPDTGFSVGRAMARNKYIYAASYGTFIVESDYDKGGTWTGAMESMKNSYTRTFVWDNKSYHGNQMLIQNGALPYDPSQDNIYELVTNTDNAPETPAKAQENEYKQMSLTDLLG